MRSTFLRAGTAAAAPTVPVDRAVLRGAASRATVRRRLHGHRPVPGPGPGQLPGFTVTVTRAARP